MPSSVYSEKGRLFSITICVSEKKKIFSSRAYADLVFKAIFDNRFFDKCECMAVCLMPDHLHLLLAPTEKNLVDLLDSWKSFTTLLLQKNGWQGTVWQRSFYDHALRKDEDIQKVADYIVNNPVRTGLVSRWEEYPYSWHKWMDTNRGRPQWVAPTFKAVEDVGDTHCGVQKKDGRAPTLVYPYKDALYLNITSRCPTACEFCIKFSWNYQYRGNNLLLKSEPAVEEILACVTSPEKYSEIVFCGYGESTYRLKEMEEISRVLKAKGAKKIRLNTIGLGNLIHGRNIAPDLAKFLDCVSVSLNTADPEQWVKMHRPLPEFRQRGFESVLDFISKCVQTVPQTIVTAIALPDIELKKFKELIHALGAQIRFRPYLDEYQDR